MSGPTWQPASGAGIVSKIVQGARLQVGVAQKMRTWDLVMR
jgi:hypothetical protein